MRSVRLHAVGGLQTSDTTAAFPTERESVVQGKAVGIYDPELHGFSEAGKCKTYKLGWDENRLSPNK
jgi:hypothetical protein